MFFQVTVACLFGIAAAAPSLPLAPIVVDSVSVPHYNFNYGVSDPHTGDYKTQHESRAGGTVRGSYSVAEPDGTMRVVDYSADPHTGFNAHVRKLGAAMHPPQIMTAIHAPIITHLPAHLMSPMPYPSHGRYELGHGHLGYGHGYLGYQYGHHGYQNGYNGYRYGHHGSYGH